METAKEETGENRGKRDVQIRFKALKLSSCYSALNKQPLQGSASALQEKTGL